MKFTNIAKGPRGLNTKSGTVLVDAGHTADVEISDVEHKSAMASGWFVEGDAPKSVADTATDIAGLKAIIAEHEATIADLQAKLAEATKDDDKSEDRASLKAQATELKLDFPANIPTDKLKALIDAKLAA